MSDSILLLLCCFGVCSGTLLIVSAIRLVDLEEDRCMRIYLVTDQDIQMLLTMIDRNPEHGTQGGSSTCLSVDERRFHNEAHGFFNYQVRTWIDKYVKKES
jgi:hypothetical protein